MSTLTFPRPPPNLPPHICLAGAFVAAMIPSSSINVPVPAVVQAAVLGPVTEVLLQPMMIVLLSTAP